MLDDLPLLAVEFQALPQHVLGGFILVDGFERPRALVEGRRLVRDRRAVDGGHFGQGGRPLDDGQADLAEPLVDAPKVDVRRHEFRIERDRVFKTGLRPVEASGIREDDGVVEKHGIQQRIFRIALDPRRVGGLDGSRLSALFERFGRPD